MKNRSRSPYVIAEAGVNHNGEIAFAYKLIDAAKAAGADCIKFQAFDVASMCIYDASLASYQSANLNEEVSQYEMLTRYQFGFNEFAALRDACDRVGIDFLLSVFDVMSLALWRRLNLDSIKIPSGEINNQMLLSEIGKHDVYKYLSTGASYIEEIDDALAFLCPGRGINDVAVLHCTSSYPCLESDVNMSVIGTLIERYGCKVGYSDHTLGTTAAIVAVSLGAKVLEKHITLDNNLSGPDHVASMNTVEFKRYVEAVKSVNTLLGSSVKCPTETESVIRPQIRKGVYAGAKIRSGESFRTDNLLIARPENGVPPNAISQIIGRVARRNYMPFEKIDVSDLSDDTES